MTNQAVSYTTFLAAAVFTLRRRGVLTPIGHVDKNGQWSPSTFESCSMCDLIQQRGDSKVTSLFDHCKSIQHIANRYNIDVEQIQKTVDTYSEILKDEAFFEYLLKREDIKEVSYTTYLVYKLLTHPANGREEL